MTIPALRNQVCAESEAVVSPGQDLDALAETISRCRLCRDCPRREPLPHEPRPIFRISAKARLLIASQAPGNRAHQSGIPFDDPSGVRLRSWMGIEPDRFYDRDRVAIVPMGFCFPGHDAQKGDLPPRPECRDAWHDRIFAAMPQVELILTVGLYAIRYHLARIGHDLAPTAGMTDVVAGWRHLETGRMPRLLPLPHPSWRNSAWLKRNPWFEAEILPFLRNEVRRLTA